MNNKGFTLTELIVAIAIMGIISVLAFPSVRKLKEDNEVEKYKSYAKVLENGAKLYIDSYKYDLFSGNSSTKITYQTLLDENLIETYIDKAVDCTDSFVCASKVSSYGTIKYQVAITCKKADKIIYSDNSTLSC